MPTGLLERLYGQRQVTQIPSRILRRKEWKMVRYDYDDQAPGRSETHNFGGGGYGNLLGLSQYFLNNLQ